MYVVTVEIEIRPGAETEFMEHMRAQARNSLSREPGCRHFDVSVDPEEPRKVFLYEIYDDRAAFDAHLQSSHFASFDQAVQPLMAAKSAASYHRLPLD